jgi:FixJ family two-component response regulator
MSSRTTTPLIAIVDDDESVRCAVYGVLKSGAYEARSFASAGEFLRSGLQRTAACVISDVRMPDMSGLELQARLAEEGCRVPIIFITAYGDSRMRSQAMKAGAVVFLGKPFDDKVLLDSVRAALNMTSDGTS